MSSHHKHKHKPDNNVFKHGLSNRNLVILIVAVFVLVVAGIYRYYSSSSRFDWAKFQAQNLSNFFAPSNRTEKPNVKIAKSLTIPILMYHHVGPLPARADRLRRDMTVSKEDFELQVAWLKGQGFTSITLQDLLKYKQGQFKLPERPVIFTFDDGYSDVFENAEPVLKKYGFTGSFGIITLFPGMTQGTNQYASWQQIKQAQKDGMEIVSHTQDHFDGTSPRYDAAFILRDLTDSQNDLKNNLGASLPIMIYPYGHYNQQYITAAEKAGFTMALTTRYGQKVTFSNLMEIPRVRVHGGEDLETFKRTIIAGEKAVGSNEY